QWRVRRGSEAYLTRVHGAFGQQLNLVAQFFAEPWTTPRDDLTPGDRAWLLSSAAFCMTALGRLSDSVEPRRAGLEMRIAQEKWPNAAIAGGELAGTLLTLGRVDEAVETAEAAVRHADHSRDDEQPELRRSDLAAALTAAGNLDRAAALFAEAEAIDQNAPQLYSLRGYQYGDLLLARGAAAEALDRGRYQLDLAERFLGQGLGLDDIGFGHLLIGRAQDALGDADASGSLDDAVAGLRKSGLSQFVPAALLARAAHLRVRAAAGEAGLIEAIHTDLDEVADIAGEEMERYLTDLALERARLALDVPAAVRDASETAAAQTARAAELIAKTGYHRRDGELAALQARLG
ncbi:MAG: hypothetical protein AAFP26_14000, partial [Planctomycetota bacterium]